MTSTNMKFTVAICGGGIGGSTLAHALSSSVDIQVDLYEAASTFGEVGAGLGIFWRPRRVLEMVGLGEEMKALGGEVSATRSPTFHLRKADQPEGLEFMTMTSFGGALSMHRAEFHSVLHRHLSSRCKTYNSKRLLRYEEPMDPNAPLTLYFDDGTIALCDVLVGADGLKSSVRASMMKYQAEQAEKNGKMAEAKECRDAIRAQFSGLISYRTTVPRENLARINPEHPTLFGQAIYIGKNSNIVAYPISQGTLINIAVFCADYKLEGSQYPDPWVSRVDPQQVIQLFDHWELEVRQLVSSLQGVTVNMWAVNVVKPLASFSSGRAAVMGDAAHAMVPFRGAGAGQAIEDAHILAALLSHDLTTRATLTHALQIYSQIRQPIAIRVAEDSRHNGMIFTLHVDGADDIARLPELGKMAQENFDWYTEVDPLEDVKSAHELLEAVLSGA